MSRDTWPARYKAGATLKQIAAEDGVHFNTVDRHLMLVGVKMRRPGPARAGDPREWAKLYRRGSSLAEIADQAGCTAGCVHRNLLLLGVRMRPRGRRPGRRSA